MTPQTPVQQAKAQLLKKIDEACIARGELHAVDRQDEQDMRRWQAHCQRAECACEVAITAFARAIRRASWPTAADAESAYQRQQQKDRGTRLDA